MISYIHELAKKKLLTSKGLFINMLIGGGVSALTYMTVESFYKIMQFTLKIMEEKNIALEKKVKALESLVNSSVIAQNQTYDQLKNDFTSNYRQFIIASLDRNKKDIYATMDKKLNDKTQEFLDAMSTHRTLVDYDYKQLASQIQKPKRFS